MCLNIKGECPIKTVRELLANALVHRSYTQRGDIFINLKIDRLEIHSPGPLPLGVTPKNILHTSIKRNEGLAKVFYDLLLMEREGSGYDRIYEVLLLGGKSIPVVEEGNECVTVTIYKKTPDPHIIDFMAKADEAFQLTQKERICLGLLTQHKSFNVMQLTTILNLKDASHLEPWLSRLVSFDLVKSAGKTRGKTFSINPTTLRLLQFTGKTNLKTIEPHRLYALILEDLKTYHESSKTEIHSRIGTEISIRTLERTLVSMVEKGVIGKKGIKRYTRYFYLPESGK
jgi:ATP-dependent DNA helicase RecG